MDKAGHGAAGAAGGAAAGPSAGASAFAPSPGAAEERRAHVDALLAKGRERWFKNTEVCDLLCNHKAYNLPLQPAVSDRPPAGSVLLYDRNKVRFFRKDGHVWQKKKDGKSVRETHEKLKVGAVECLNCYYAHAEANPRFQRRCYWLLQPDTDEGIVLVHYLEMNCGPSREPHAAAEHAAARKTAGGVSAHAPPAVASASGSASQPTVVGAPRHAGEGAGRDSDGELALDHLINAPHSSMNLDLSHLLFDSSVNESALLDSDGEKMLQQLFETESAVSRPPAGAAPQPVAQLSIKDKPHAVTGLSQPGEPAMASRTAAQAGAQPGWNPITVQDLEDRIDEMQEMLFRLGKDHTTAPGAAEGAEESPVWASEVAKRLTELEAGATTLLGRHSAGQKARGKRPAVRFTSEEEDSGLDTETVAWVRNTLGGGGTGWNTHPSTTAVVPMSADSDSDAGARRDRGSLSNSRPPEASGLSFNVADHCPDWDMECGGAKVLVTGQLQNHGSHAQAPRLFCKFGQVEVPAEWIMPGVLRCIAPPHSPGHVQLCVTAGGGRVVSAVRMFEYRSSRTTPDSAILRAQDLANVSSREFHLQLIDMLLPAGDREDAKGEQTGMTPDGSGAQGSAREHTLQRLRGASDDVLERTLLTMLEKRLSVVAADGSLRSRFNSSGRMLVHIVAALGFPWAVNTLGDAGADLGARDSCGLTALHWAAVRGQEETVAAIIAAGAAPSPLVRVAGALSSPADLATANGHGGIAAYLAEAALSRSLSKLSIGLSKTLSSHQRRKRQRQPSSPTVSQLPVAENDTEDEAKNVAAAAEAAAEKIQSAFRGHRRRKQREAQRYRRHHTKETELAAIAVQEAFRKRQAQRQEQEDAASAIQNAFRSWSDRNQFLNLRERVVRLQSHVRAYQQRVEYRRLRTVSYKKAGQGSVDEHYSHSARHRRRRSETLNYSPSQGSGDSHQQNSAGGSPDSGNASPAREAWNDTMVEDSEAPDDDSEGGADADNDEEELANAVTRVQAIVRCTKTRSQYLRLRKAAMTLQGEFRERFGKA